MKTIYKAGAIILSQKDPTLIALLYRSKENDWSFPKGHVEQRESVLKATQREIKEETGLSVKPTHEKLLPMRYKHSNGVSIIVHMFLMRSQDDSVLKTEFEGDKVVWVNFKKVIEKLSYNNVREYYLGIVYKIERVVKSFQSKIR